MTDADKSGKRRGLDLTGLLLFGALGVAAVAVGAGLVYGGYFTPWGLVVWLIVCGAFIAAAAPSHVAPAPKNTLVHGAARPASETEAQAAARGAVKARAIHEQKFDE
jgi:hypothetical protein